MGRQAKLKLRIFDTVTVDINLYVNDKFNKNWENVMFELGFPTEYGVLECLDKFLMSYTEFNERTLTGKAEKLFNETEMKILSVNPEDDLKIVIKLNNASSINQVWQMSVEDRLEFSKMMKVRGNDCIKRHEYPKATKIYRFILKYLKANVSIRSNEEEIKLYTSVLSNLSLCYLKVTENPEEVSPQKANDLLHGVIYCCSEILKHGPHSTKAQFRIGQANARLGSYDQALNSLAFAMKNLEIDPEVTHKEETRKLLEGALFKWREKAECDNGQYKETIRSQFRKHYCADKLDPALKGYKVVPEYVSKWYKTEFALEDNGSSEDEKLEVGTWSNEMADGIISIPDELEAFGESMPEIKKITRPNLASIDDVDENEDEF